MISAPRRARLATLAITLPIQHKHADRVLLALTIPSLANRPVKHALLVLTTPRLVEIPLRLASCVLLASTILFLAAQSLRLVLRVLLALMQTALDLHACRVLFTHVQTNRLLSLYHASLVRAAASTRGPSLHAYSAPLPR